MIDGLWTLVFKTPMAASAGGVVVCLNGRVYGGDSSYMYLGSYQQVGDTFAAQVTCKQFVANAPTVFGFAMREFTLRVNGVLRGAEVEATGVVDQIQQGILNIRMVKRADLGPDAGA